MNDAELLRVWRIACKKLKSARAEGKKDLRAEHAEGEHAFRELANSRAETRMMRYMQTQNELYPRHYVWVANPRGKGKR
jgi:hypothetical protein